MQRLYWAFHKWCQHNRGVGTWGLKCIYLYHHHYLYKGGKGLEAGQNLVDVIYGWLLRLIYWRFLLEDSWLIKLSNIGSQTPKSKRQQEFLQFLMHLLLQGNHLASKLWVGDSAMMGKNVPTRALNHLSRIPSLLFYWQLMQLKLYYYPLISNIFAVWQYHITQSVLEPWDLIITLQQAFFHIKG